MSRVIGAMILLLIVASCGGGSGSPPRNLDNACSIIKQRPEYLKAFRATERKWGVPMHVQMATIYQESRFRSDARTPHRFALGVIPLGRQSSAYGYSQALDGTWDVSIMSGRRPTSSRRHIPAGFCGTRAGGKNPAIMPLFLRHLIFRRLKQVALCRLFRLRLARLHRCGRVCGNVIFTKRAIG